MTDEKQTPGTDITSFLTSLSSISVRPQARPFTLLEPHVVENRVYKNQQINIDGYVFRNCAFFNCGITTEKGNFDLVSCHLRGCWFLFGGNALRVVKLTSLVFSTWNQLQEELRARVEPDGSVTIT